MTSTATITTKNTNLSTLPDLASSPNWKALERAAGRALPGDEGVIARCLLDVREYLEAVVQHFESRE